jgi:hypothetical protein
VLLDHSQYLAPALDNVVVPIATPNNNVRRTIVVEAVKAPRSRA